MDNELAEKWLEEEGAGYRDLGGQFQYGFDQFDLDDDIMDTIGDLD